MLTARLLDSNGKHNATDAEKVEARKIADAILAFYRERGFDPLVIDSGNGFLVIVPADLTPENDLVVQRLLQTHAAVFDSPGAKLDQKVFDPPRISAVPGTIKRKSANTAERPWRKVKLLHAGSRAKVLDEEALKALLPAAAFETPPAPVAGRGVDVGWVEDFLEHSQVAHQGRKTDRRGGFKWTLDTQVDDPCPNRERHHSDNDPSTQAVFLSPGGIPGFKCYHSACKGIHWKQFADYHDDLNEKEGRRRYRKRAPDDAIVITGAWLPEAVRRSEQVLTREELQYFQRGSDLVRPVTFQHQQQVNGISRKPASIVIQPVSDEHIQRELAENAKFVKPKRTAGGETLLVAINPPGELARHLRDRVRSGQGDYRNLDLVTSAPCLLPDGSVLDTPGHQGSILFVPGAEYPRVKTNPTRDDAISAMAKFDDIYHTFPFVTESEGQSWRDTASYAALVASILSLVARPMLPTVPLTAIRAVAAGTGKTKLAECASIAALGYAPTSVSFHGEEEFSKTLVPLLREGDRAIMIDNIEIPLEGSMLCSVLSSEEHRARILGQSEQVRLLNRGVFFATGNNLAIKGDLTRRAVMVSLDANCERPEQREFDFDPVDRARDQHPELVIAALTALQAFIRAGLPRQTKRPLLGSFEEWDRLICGCLMWLGFADPVGTRDRVIEADPQREADLELLEAWHAEYGSELKSLSELLSTESFGLQSRHVMTLLTAETDGWESNNVRTAGKRLARIEGRVIGGFKLIKGRTKEKRGWRVKKVGEEPQLEASPTSPADRVTEGDVCLPPFPENLPF